MIGRFTETAMWTAMAEMAERIGVSPSGARLLRLTNNAVFALPTAGLIIRVSRSHGLQDRVTKAVRLGNYFAHTNAPTIRLAEGIDQPVHAGGVYATAWRYVTPTADPPKIEDLGQVLCRFHAVAPPPDLPRWDPVGDAHARLDDAEALPNSDRDALLRWCESLAPRIAALHIRTEPGLIHGDAHLSNVLRDHDGQILLCDFDSTCLGPRQVDLVPVPVGEARFGGTQTHARLAAAYGYDVTTDVAWPLFREARELKMIVAAVPLLASGPHIAQEFRTRLDSIVNGDTTAAWTPFANLPM